ncbi:MAG: hypothetical protein V2A79_07880, partial [Planctomycetota bacterium]
WEQAAELCAVPGCLREREADCHVSEEFRNTGREGRAEWHRFVPARLVLVPQLLVREGVGGDR